METLHTLHPKDEIAMQQMVRKFRLNLTLIDTVDDFLRSTGNGGDLSGDRSPLGPNPTAPFIGSVAMELVAGDTSQDESHQVLTLV